MSEIEYEGIVLEDQLLDHLATPGGATAVWRERLLPEVIADEDEGIREALKFVLRYMDEYREAPNIAVIAEETGYEDFAEPVAPIEYVIEKLKERYQRKQLRAVVTKIARLSKEPDAALTYGLDELSRIRMETSSAGKTITSWDMLSVIDRYHERLEDHGEGITFGYEEIDKHLGGLLPGQVTVVLARPKRYKSWQVLKSAADAVLIGQRNVFFETMELQELEMSNRFLCMAAGVSWYRFSHNLLEAEHVRQLEKTATELAEWPHKITFHRAKRGERTVQNIVAQAMEAEAEALYVDQLSWFDGAKDEGNWRIIGKIMEELKDAAEHFPIYMAAQYNRVQAMEEGIGDLANIGLSDAIGQTADNLLGIYASRDMLENKIIQLGIVESRSFEPITWEIKVELTEHSNFRCLGVREPDHKDKD